MRFRFSFDVLTFQCRFSCSLVGGRLLITFVPAQLIIRKRLRYRSVPAACCGASRHLSPTAGREVQHRDRAGNASRRGFIKADVQCCVRRRPCGSAFAVASPARMPRRLSNEETRVHHAPRRSQCLMTARVEGMPERRFNGSRETSARSMDLIWSFVLLCFFNLELIGTVIKTR